MALDARNYSSRNSWCSAAKELLRVFKWNLLKRRSPFDNVDLASSRACVAATYVMPFRQNTCWVWRFTSLCD
eukprot:2308250-Amphidinium_carterae.1